MKPIYLSSFKLCFLTLIFLFGITVQLNSENLQPTPEYRNFYGICWDRNAHQNLTFARQMGYDYVFYQRGMEDDSLSNDLHFYLESPEFMVYPRYVYINKEYTEKEISYFLNNSALKDTTSKFRLFLFLRCYCCFFLFCLDPSLRSG